MKRGGIFFWIGAIVFLVVIALMTKLIGNEYPFFAGYVILQFIVLAVAWSILGGHAGYVNFGTSAFFGMGVYTAVFLFKVAEAPLLVQIAAAAAVGALMGFLLGLLTLRMQGIFFSIATIALTIVIETSITNWRYVGGAASRDPGAHAWHRQEPIGRRGFDNCEWQAVPGHRCRQDGRGNRKAP
jgi:branched-chain amino acid transport system permease protein